MCLKKKLNLQTQKHLKFRGYLSQGPPQHALSHVNCTVDAFYIGKDSFNSTKGSIYCRILE